MNLTKLHLDRMEYRAIRDRMARIEREREALGDEWEALGVRAAEIRAEVRREVLGRTGTGTHTHPPKTRPEPT